MKFRDIVLKTMGCLTDLGFKPLFPNLGSSTSNKDVATSAEEKAKLAWDHYKSIEEADAVYLILPGGYMGTSVKLELGYALALKKPIYFSELTKDIALDCYCAGVIPVDQLHKFSEVLTKSEKS